VSPARVPRVAGGAVLAIGLAALAGWQLDVAWLESFAPGQAVMNPAAALALVLLGIALYLVPERGASPAGAWVAHACAIAAALLGLIRLLGYVFRFDPGVDRLLFAERVTMTLGPPSSVAPQTALSCVLIGAALLLRSRHTPRGQLGMQLLALAAAFVALVAVTAHTYGTRLLYGAMSLNTAFAFLFAAVGVLSSQPEHGVAALVVSATPGGVLVRRLMPLMTVITLLFGWLRLAGERAGLFDTAGGTAMFTAGMIAALAALAWWSARALDRTDAERRAAERAVQATKARFQEVLASSTAVIYANTVDGESFSPSWVSENVARVTGYDAQAAMGPKWWLDHLHPDDRRRVLAEIPALFRLDRLITEYRFRHADGTYRWVRDESRLLRDAGGAPLEVFGAWMDITEHQQAQEALRASEERFRAVAATANDAIISADSRGAITYFNPGAERILGYSAAEVNGQPLTVLMPERYQEAHRAGLARYLATGVARVVGKTVELVGRRKDGTEFPLEISIASWRREGDVAFTAIIRDITERRQAEETLRRYATQLESANAELDAFAYSVSHDLRAPLRSIDGFSQALLEDCADRLDATGQDFLRRVRTASQRMAELIDDLLNLSRVTRAQMQPAPVDLSALARAIATDLAARDPSRQIEFVIAPKAGVHADPGLMRVALQNLLDNAWKFTRKRPQARIEFGVTAHDGKPSYFVRDNGAGFDMTYAAKLFGAFQRLHSTSDFEGTGIGLATVQRVVRRHGGRVWAEGVVDGGATFYFTL
jgi:PAS domain S-box-containing protein